jgi:hypothetical protein
MAQAAVPKVMAAPSAIKGLVNKGVQAIEGMNPFGGPVQHAQQQATDPNTGRFDAKAFWDAYNGLPGSGYGPNVAMASFVAATAAQREAAQAVSAAANGGPDPTSGGTDTGGGSSSGPPTGYGDSSSAAGGGVRPGPDFGGIGGLW